MDSPDLNHTAVAPETAGLPENIWFELAEPVNPILFPCNACLVPNSAKVASPEIISTNLPAVGLNALTSVGA